MHQTGEFIRLWLGYYPPGVFGGVIGNSAHNIWLSTAATMGFGGVLAVLMLFVVYWRIGSRRMRFLRAQSDGSHSWVVRSCMVLLFVFFVQTQFLETGMLRGALSESMLFWLTLVLVLSSPAAIRERFQAKAGRIV